MSCSLCSNIVNLEGKATASPNAAPRRAAPGKSGGAAPPDAAPRVKKINFTVYHSRGYTTAPRNESCEKFVFHGVAFSNARARPAFGGAAPLGYIELCVLSKQLIHNSLTTT